MFNINLDDLKSIAGESNAVAYPTVNKEQLQELFVCEALQYMSRRELGDDAKDQAIYNRSMAAALREDVTTAPQYLVELFKRNIGAVQSANINGDNAQFVAAVTGLEMFLSFLSQIAGAMVRSAFYTHDSAERSESHTVDLIRQGNTATTGSAESRAQSVSYYAGPRTAVVMPETVEESIDEITGFFGQLYASGVSMTTQWFKQRSPALQLGGKTDDSGNWEAFITRDEMWLDIKATRDERAAVSAAARSNALGSSLALINGLRASEGHGSISGDKPQPVVTKRAPRKAVQQ